LMRNSNLSIFRPLPDSLSPPSKQETSISPS
jgi:hypothetical protein